MSRRTKFSRAAELLRKLETGPAWAEFDADTRNRIGRAYHLWASTWITPEVRDLIPQLKDARPPTLTRRDEAEITTAHSVRQLRKCAGCGGMGMKPKMITLDAPMREAPAGDYHSHCIVILLGEKVLKLPQVERDKLTLDAMGVELARKVVSAEDRK